MFRFTIRDVLWLMVVVGLAIAWALDHWTLYALAARFEWRALTLASAFNDQGCGTVVWNVLDPGFEIKEPSGGTIIYPADSH